MTQDTLTRAPNTPRETTRGGSESDARPTILLIHGGFVDGSGWEGVYAILKKDGYRVSVVQNSSARISRLDMPVARSRLTRFSFLVSNSFTVGPLII